MMNGETMESITIRERRSAGDEARLVQMLKALGNPVRFQIMQTLAERQTCITQEIVETTPLAQSTVSQHLKVLREAGLIEGETEGPATCYCLNEAGVRWLKEAIEGWLPGCCEPGVGGVPGQVKPFQIREEPGSRGACCS
jgi:ArsR family transcriptional regulator, arsenate/arsenite/antimonite-responsive transcriptional repressor